MEHLILPGSAARPLGVPDLGRDLAGGPASSWLVSEWRRVSEVHAADGVSATP
jgi:hypothetical protein